MRRGTGLVIFLIVTLLGCATPRPAASTPPEAGAPAAPAVAQSTRTLVVATDTPVDGFGTMFFGGKSGPEELAGMVHRGLSDIDDKGVYYASAALELPSVDKGTWRILPDGRTDTTWKLRPNAKWHDGTPFTAQDLVFSWQVAIAPDVPYKERTAAKLIDSIEVVDPQTAVIHWQSFMLNAGRLTGVDLFLLPRHLLEDRFLNDRQGFVNSSFWNSEFIGIGPYRITGWIPGTSADIEAFEGYYGEQPKIRKITFKIIPDVNTGIANILSNEVDVWLGSSLGVEHAQLLKNQWTPRTGGQVITTARLIFEIRLAPGDPKVSDLRMRKALYHAIDRETIVRDVYSGLVQVAHSWVAPGTSGFDVIDAQTTKYAYDPTRALQYLAELGIQKGADGQLRDATGEVFTLPFSTTIGNQERESMQATIASYWKDLGFSVPIQNVTLQVQGDPNYHYSTTDLSGLGADFENNLPRVHSHNLRTPENPRGANQFGYSNPEVDRLLDEWGRTPERPKQIEIEAQVIHFLSEELPILPINYRIEAITAVKELKNVLSRTAAPASTNTWNVETWTLG